MVIFEKAQDLLLHPRAAWSDLSDEAASVLELYTTYAAVLAALPALARLIGTTVVGVSFFGTRYRAPVIGALGYALTSYVLTLGALYVFAMIVDGLAARFDSKGSFVAAMKLSVYSATASWASGVLLIWPALWPLAALLSLYSFYGLYLGLPVLMGTPREKQVPYFVMLVISGLILSTFVTLLTTLLFPEGRMGV